MKIALGGRAVAEKRAGDVVFFAIFVRPGKAGGVQHLDHLATKADELCLLLR